MSLTSTFILNCLVVILDYFHSFVQKLCKTTTMPLQYFFEAAGNKRKIKKATITQCLCNLSFRHKPSKLTSGHVELDRCAVCAFQYLILLLIYCSMPETNSLTSIYTAFKKLLTEGLDFKGQELTEQFPHKKTKQMHMKKTKRQKTKTQMLFTFILAQRSACCFKLAAPEKMSKYEKLSVLLMLFFTVWSQTVINNIICAFTSQLFMSFSDDLLIQISHQGSSSNVHCLQFKRKYGQTISATALSFM